MNSAVIIFSIFYAVRSNKVLDMDSDSLWNEHKLKYRLNFGANEDGERRAIFDQNLRFIAEYNSKNEEVTLAMNNFGHLRTPEIIHGLKIISEEQSTEKIEKVESSLPIKRLVDWRKSSVVTQVKNQGECGSCYAFSAVGAIESHYAIRTGTVKELSKQEVVDCSTEFPNEGCNGGLPNSVFQYARKHGLSLEDDYQYNASKSACEAKSKPHMARLLSYRTIPMQDEKELVRVLSFIGPVSICFNANHSEVFFYKSGIIDIKNCPRERINHAALVVGYNTKGTKPYLIVKNSWGSEWGEDGYFRIALFKNMCGVANFASYPIVDESR